MEGIWCGSQSTTLLSVARFTFRANGGEAQAQSLVCDTRTLIQDDLSLPSERNTGPWVTFPVKTRTSKWAERWRGEGAQRGWRTPGQGAFLVKNAPSGRPREIQFGSFRPNTDASPPGHCIIYECWHILRLNICWFVQSANTGSRPSPWHISLADRKQRCTFNWWVPRLVTRSPELPSLLSSAPHRGRPERGEGDEQAGGVRAETGVHWARSQLPIRRGQLPGSPPPLHLFALTPLYVRFHLKAATTYLETEMDRKTGRGRESRAICQNGGGMLTAAVGANISTLRQRKMAILKDDRKEDI